MNYNITIDQEFAVVNNLTLTEVNCLAACLTLQTWSESFNIDGKTWYWYSEDKMVIEFPLLFGIPKRVYKNLKILSDKGFIELSNIGRKKVLCITGKCAEWGRPKSKHQTENGLNQTENGLNQTENGLNQTENGLNQTENGLNQTENGLNIYNNTIYKSSNDKSSTDKDEMGILFFPESSQVETKKFSEENGLTEEDLQASRKTIDKMDKIFESLIFPFDDNEVKRLYYILCCSPNWKGKTKNAIQMSLKKMSKYDVDFIRILIENSIAGGWSGIVYPDTEKKYQEYLKSKKVGVDVGGGVTFTKMSDEERKEAEWYLNL